MAEDLEPLSAGAQELLRWEKSRPGASPADHTRVLERLIQAQGLAPAPAAAGSVGSKAMLSKLTVAAVLGAATGGTLMHQHMSARLEDVRLELVAARQQFDLGRQPQVELPPVAPPRVEGAGEKPTPKPLPKSGPSQAKSPEAVPETRPTTLREESVLLERARTALLKGDFDSAAAAVNAHRDRFPAGDLVEEAEVMGIQVWLGRHRDEEARAAASRFHRDHPGSALLPAVDALVAPEP
ncbi:MAG: outer membrane protein assembly factor BamD [Archangiaceae bacterium]|nr:outer membrane protein assembly factor BamD [Archangiaceae bacterium]